MSMGKKENTIKILIVEDSPTQAENLKHILEEQGHRIVHAMNGRDALTILNDQKPDLVISDIVMPEMDGFELCNNIKEDERLRSTPVILLTSLSDPQDVIKAVQCGADQFVTKPYDEKHLLATVEHLLHDVNQQDREDDSKGIYISSLRGEKYLIKSSRRQILNLLLSTYESAYQQNRELIRTQNELRALNEELDKKVAERTAHLNEEIVERKKAEAELKKKAEELRNMSQQLWQAAKLATMGELASSIAHELNNPLTTVGLSVELLIAKTHGDDPRRRKLEIIGQEVERMGNLVSNLLQFSRRNQQQISTVDVCDEIEKTLELIHYHLRKRNIEVAREFDPERPLIHADRQQLRQLFLNLFTNASDAMPEGGTLTIRVYVRGSGVGDQGSEDRGQGSEDRGQGSGIGDQGAGIRDQGAEDRGQGSEDRGQGSGIGDQGAGIRGQESGVGPTPDPRSPTPAFVVVEIADTGVGIPPDILPRILEPFYTTKPEGKGTGLGLAICRRIVQEHCGTLNITSEGFPGKGTRVCITLPFSNGHNTASLKDE